MPDTLTREALTQDALHRLAFIRELAEDWDSYGALPTADAAADILVKVLNVLVKDDGPTPQLCPMVDGGVEVEWVVGNDYLSVECEARGRLSFYAETEGRDMWEADGVAFTDAAEHLDRAAALLADMAPNVKFRRPEFHGDDDARSV